MSWQMIALIAAAICFVMWGIVNLFMHAPANHQKEAADTCGAIGIVLVIVVCVVSVLSGINKNTHDDATNQLTKQGFEVVQLTFGSETKQGTAVIKYHGCIGTFEFREVTTGSYQVGEEVNGNFVELTNIEKPHWTSCQPAATSPS